MPPDKVISPFRVDNVRRFLLFRVTFNSRFYYPVFTILFLDFGLSVAQFAMLNVVWALSIVLLEVPSGALADVIGRRNLLVTAAGLMVAELALLCFTPRGDADLVFAAFLLNRVLSGAAEAAASGADEALAYDSLAREGNACDWRRVLDWQIRLQAIGYMLAMVLGAALYDPALIQWLADALGLGWTVTQAQTLRLPLYLTLGLALATLWNALGMREERPEREGGREGRGAVRQAFRVTLEAGAWIARTPFALAIILFGMLFDHSVRLVVTLTSQYYRVIELPEASFGLIGSAMAGMGILAPRLAMRMADRFSPGTVALLLGGTASLGFFGVSLALPWWGLAPMALLMVVAYGQGFFVSHYLNQITDGSQRATVLSFKGLSFNLAYGVVGMLYSLLLAVLRGRVSPEELARAGGSLENATFVASLEWLPWYFVVFFLGLMLYCWQGSSRYH